MKVFASGRNVALVQFEQTIDDYRMFHQAILDFDRRLDLPWHPLMFDQSDAYRRQFAELFLRITRDPVSTVFRLMATTHQDSGEPWRWVGNLALEIIRARVLKRPQADGPVTACISIYVFEQWRRRSYAMEALCLLEGIARDVVGATALTAGIAPANTASIALFRRLGYIDHGVATRGRSGWAIRGHHYLRKALPRHRTKVSRRSLAD